MNEGIEYEMAPEDKDARVTIQIRIDEKMRNEFYEKAKSKAQNPSQLIRLWINQYLQEDK